MGAAGGASPAGEIEIAYGPSGKNILSQGSVLGLIVEKA